MNHLYCINALLRVGRWELTLCIIIANKTKNKNIKILFGWAALQGCGLASVSAE